MQSKLLADILITLYTFRMVVGPAMGGYMAAILYLQSAAQANPNFAFMMVAAGLGLGTYKLLFVEDPRKPQSGE